MTSHTPETNVFQETYFFDTYYSLDTNRKVNLFYQVTYIK